MKSPMPTEDEIHIVLARLQCLPPNLKVNIGSDGAYTRDELIEKVDGLLKAGEGDEVGELIVRVYMNGIKSFKKGLYA